MFVAFEGGDGSGKSTQVEQLARRLRAAGHQVVLTREPGAGTIGEQIRAIVLDHAPSELTARAEALLFAADRAQHVASIVRPGLAAGSVVITDRYVDSSIAYQGVGRELGVEDVRTLSDFATGGLVPDLTVVLDVPSTTGRSRAAQHGGGVTDRIESEPEVMHAQVRQAYLDQAAGSPQRYLVLDGTRPVDDLAAEICDTVLASLGAVIEP